MKAFERGIHCRNLLREILELGGKLSFWSQGVELEPHRSYSLAMHIHEQVTLALCPLFPCLSNEDDSCTQGDAGMK